MTKQSQLEHYLELKRVEKAATEAVEKAKAALLADYDGNVEVGPIHMKVDVQKRQTFSYDAIVDAIGRLQADHIKSLLPFKSSTVLTVKGPS